MNNNGSPSTTKPVLTWLLDNVEAIVSILVLSSVVLWGWFVDNSVIKNTPLILGGMTAILIVLVIASWRDKHGALTELGTDLKDLKKDVKERTIVQLRSGDETFLAKDDCFRQSGMTYPGRLSSSSSIDICGRTLSGTIRDYQPIFTERLKAGVNVRVILIDHLLDESLNQLVKISYNNAANVAAYRSLLEFHCNLLDGIGKQKGVRGSLLLGHLPFVPAFGLTVLDSNLDNGLVFLEIYQHKVNNSPGTIFDRLVSPRSFNEYREQFEIMWSECKDAGRIDILA